MMQAQALLAELATVEKEINWLERRTLKLKMNLYRERQLNSKWEMQQPQNDQQVQLPCRQEHQAEPYTQEWLSATPSQNRSKLEEGRSSLSSASGKQSCSSSKSNGKKSILIVSKLNHPRPPGGMKGIKAKAVHIWTKVSSKTQNDITRWVSWYPLNIVQHLVKTFSSPDRMYEIMSTLA